MGKGENLRDLIQQVGYTKSGRFMEELTMNDFEKKVDQAEKDILTWHKQKVLEEVSEFETCDCSDCKFGKHTVAPDCVEARREAITEK